MNFNKADITGIVLAGGQSRRMGFNKAEATMHGESMLIRMIEKLKKITSAIVVSSGTVTYPNIPWPQISDEHPQCGPLGGIYSVMKATTSSLNLVVSCDMPLVSIALLEHIVDKAKESKALITLPVDHEGQLQMMCAVYHKDVLPILQQQIDAHTFKMKDVLDLVSVEYIKILREHPLYDEHAFMNVNSPINLEEARKLWSNQKRVVSDKWIKASVLAGLWAGIEIIAGSFLHNLRIPFSGTILTLISIILVIGFFQIWPKYGIIWRAGLITALMKSISPSAVILGPMIAITLEGFIMELVIRIAGRNIMGYVGAGMLTMIGVLTHKVVRLFLLYGWDIFLIYEEMFNFATEKLGLTNVQPLRAVLSLFLVYAVLGALAAFIGYRLGQRTKNEQNKYTLSSETHSKQWQKPSEEIKYSTRFLILLVVVIPIMLYALSNVRLGAALILTLPWFILIFWRYRFAMRQLKKWLFWMQLLVILVLAWFFSKTSGGGLEGRLIALSGGMIMVLRALVVVTGFAALSTELRAPLMQRIFFRSGFRQLYLSVNHAFGILPMVISSFTSPRQFILNPARSIASSLRHVNSWHQYLVRSLDKEEFY